MKYICDAMKKTVIFYEREREREREREQKELSDRAGEELVRG